MNKPPASCVSNLTSTLWPTPERHSPKTVTLPDRGQQYHLGELAYEAPELEGVLTADDVKTVADTPGTVAIDVRSGDSRWRKVLEALRDIEAEAPRLIEVVDALELLNDTSRPRVHCRPGRHRGAGRCKGRT
jgi:hypothetical protein